jgi:hypothetical protein
MDGSTRNFIAECLETVAAQSAWDAELWQQCYDAVCSYSQNELLAYVHDDLIHYSGLFHSHNILGFRVKPDRYQLEHYRQEFCDIASALRADITLAEAKIKYDL